MKVCWACHGHGYVTTGSRRLVYGEPYDDIEEIPCPVCNAEAVMKEELEVPF